MAHAMPRNASPMASNRFPPPAAAGFRTNRLIARVSAAADSFWRQRPSGWAAAAWAVVAVALSLALYFVPAPMPPAVPAVVEMAVNGEVRVPLEHGVRRADPNRPGGSSDQHALDAAAVGARDVVGHPALAQ
ncbi:MAG: hypothetical protein JSS46_16265 [Proteobacteria bacterium]|nr:hypothetical protein [Pseudomonadota bacterium]